MFFDFLRKGRVDEGDSPRDDDLRMLSFLPANYVFPHGLPVVAIQGTFTDLKCSVEGFRENPVFVDFMHEVIRTVGPTDSSMQKAAAEQENGWVYVIDLRTPEGPFGRVPPEDIIGGFEVKHGRLIGDSCWRNEKHRVLTKNGPVQLPPFLQQALVRVALGRARHLRG